MHMPSARLQEVASPDVRSSCKLAKQLEALPAEGYEAQRSKTLPVVDRAALSHLASVLSDSATRVWQQPASSSA
jgi:hypothetical protein